MIMGWPCALLAEGVAEPQTLTVIWRPVQGVTVRRHRDRCVTRKVTAILAPWPLSATRLSAADGQPSAAYATCCAEGFFFFFFAGIESQTKHHGRRHARQPPGFSAPLRPCRLVPAFGNPWRRGCRAVRALPEDRKVWGVLEVCWRDWMSDAMDAPSGLQANVRIQDSFHVHLICNDLPPHINLW